MDDTTTVYGPKTTENPAFYSMAHLEEDMAAGTLLYAAVQQLMNGNPGAATAHPHVSNAIKEAEGCYNNTPPTEKNFWLQCLEGCISAADAPGNPFYFPSLLQKLTPSISSHSGFGPQEG